METRIDWRQIWNNDLDAHRRKLPGSPADQNNIEVQSNITEEKQFCQISMKKNKASSVVIGGHPAGLMQRSYVVGHPQRRMIVYYDRYDQFQQVPCGPFLREGLTGAKFGFFGAKFLDAHRRKLPGSPADQNNVEHQRSGKIRFVKY